MTQTLFAPFAFWRAYRWPAVRSVPTRELPHGSAIALSIVLGAMVWAAIGVAVLS